ncbi:MAG: hypothetical protein IKJ88_06625 [Clostridia bacterium]|nr:hypothetical protein [Clostridia bacterium]
MKNIKITVALLLSVLFIFLTGCNVRYVSDILSTTDSAEITTALQVSSVPESTTAVQVTPVPESTTAPTVTLAPETTTVPPVTAAPETTTVPPVTAAPETTTVPPVTAAPETTVQTPAVDYSTFTKEQICDTFVTAVNKTKRYTAPINVHHTESFDFEVKECVGGDLVTYCVNNLLALVVKPSDTTYSYNNGMSVDEDGEAIPMLVPETGDCVLPASGVARAEIREENGLIHIYLVLVEEHTGMGGKPQYNAGCIGYLNTDDYSFSILKITEADIGYTGTEIDAYILPNGMVDKVTYRVNLDSSGTGTGLGITGSARIVGSQTEMWDLIW